MKGSGTRRNGVDDRRAEPFKTLAEEALTLVLAELAGADVAPVVRVPAQLVIRRSCVAREPRARTRVRTSRPRCAPSASEHFGEQAARVAALIDAELGSSRLGAGRLGAAHEARFQLFEALQVPSSRACKGILRGARADTA